MVGADSLTPGGTAGINYNQTPNLTITGSVNSGNYNDGGTLYMQGIASKLGVSIPNLVDGILANMLTSDMSDDLKLKIDVVYDIFGYFTGFMALYSLYALADEYALSISATTRDPRDGETDGVEYFFKTKYSRI